MLKDIYTKLGEDTFNGVAFKKRTLLFNIERNLRLCDPIQMNDFNAFGKNSLLDKYDLNIEQLDYKFIKNCKDVKVLENILIVLRSGEEGVFPDLITFCEHSLRQMDPKSDLLNLPERVLKFSDLTESERTEIETYIHNWTSQDNEGKCLPDNVESDLPPVRGTSVKVETKAKKKCSVEYAPIRKCKPRTYEEWDKLNVDKELEKLDDDKENEPLERSPKKKSELDKCVSNPGITEKERKFVAELEKNKGNEAFKANDYEEAIVYYTRSLSAFKSTAALNNRAQAYLKMKNYHEVIKDCNAVLMMEPHNIKALYRRGLSYREESIYDFAKQDFKLILELDPDNKLAKNQLKEIKHLKLSKTNRKKVLIEEVNSTDNKENITESPERTKGTRLTIEEVSSSSNMLEFSELDSSSDDENYGSQLSQNVRNMLKIKQNPKKITSGNENVIGNVDMKKSRTKKLSLIEEFHEEATKLKQKGTSVDVKSLNSEFVNIKIECDTKDHKYSNGNGEKDEPYQNDQNIKQSTENMNDFNTAEKEKPNNLTSDIDPLNLHKTDDTIWKEHNSGENEFKINQIKDSAVHFVNFEGLEVNTSTTEDTIDEINDEVTPYQFLHTWVSKNANNDSNLGAKYLLKIKPHELPRVVSDKLDGPLLYGLLKAIFNIYELGENEEGNKYLSFLSQVPRIKIASLFLSKEEIQSIKHLFSRLDDDSKVVHTYLQNIL